MQKVSTGNNRSFAKSKWEKIATAEMINKLYFFSFLNFFWGGGWFLFNIRKRKERSNGTSDTPTASKTQWQWSHLNHHKAANNRQTLWTRPIQDHCKSQLTTQWNNFRQFVSDIQSTDWTLKAIDERGFHWQKLFSTKKAKQVKQ